MSIKLSPAVAKVLENEYLRAGRVFFNWDATPEQVALWGGTGGEGDEQPEFSLAVEVVLCGNCGGEGQHLRNSLRGIAFSSSDEDYDPDFMDEMREGNYDQRCDECGGEGRIYDLVEPLEGSKERALYDEVLETMGNYAQMDADDAYTRRMKSGGYGY